ncbi:MAG: DNA repair protein RecN [Clostridiales bacterium]|nr:DNA repair protein RecN [Bacillota bacterium]MEE0517350.1 DNA repair protein RecN [Anaerovoracaceae bacterium]PWL94549.1 MAG: DNA repair protein RecN [Clostridiales bacterium]
MISHISIKNFAIIKNTEVEFKPGLNIITGETGSGKSIVIEAVSLALGSRADSSYVRTGTDKAVIQLVGNIGEDEFVITREISQTGKNLCKLNGEIVTLAQINRIASKMADIHGQYDNQSLLDPEYHIVLLDSYKHDETYQLKENVSNLFQKYSKCKSSLARLLAGEKENARKLDFYKYEYEEISKAHLIPGEDKELEERVSVLQNSEKIYCNLNRAYETMYNDSPSSMDGLMTGVKALEEISEYSSEISALSEELGDLYYRLEDLCRQLSSIRDSVVFSPEELDENLMRLNTIDDLKKKYGNTIEDILEYKKKLAKTLSVSENLGETKTTLMKELKSLKSQLLNACILLTEARLKKASELEEAIQKELNDLNFNNSSVKISIEPLKEPDITGMDKVEILITTNKGEPLKPLYKIASGGEMSRIMLAFKNIISSYDNIPTLIFDEIDNGISGITASIVGRKLKEISSSHQVICITHLPQIAATGDYNYRIYKESDETSTYTSVEPLTEEKKIEEIARLLGGAVITETTLQSAKELIQGC